MSQRYISKKQYADMVGVSAPAVSQWVASGSIPPSCIVNLGGRELLDLDEIERLGVLRRHMRTIPRLVNRPLFDDAEDEPPIAANAAGFFPEIQAPKRTGPKKPSLDDEDLFVMEKRARIQKLQAEADIANMNLQRAEGKLLDADRFWDIFCDMYSNFSAYFQQFSEQASASLVGMKSQNDAKHLLDTRLAQVMERIRSETEKKKLEARHLIDMQRKPLKF
ncbi:MAG TPA: hypothetical protein VE954_06675 [Oligoflexus sp.]|uniref:hypothetical protein n=1 Tax=Oligoflexus sp. TaxID=1971216 RepID=UPI002D40E10C|nr:hypothetical protein [Oligoflexus sp.]HYX32781.1 hypothetical protein [Oligoflexus sp.]